jgi:hypothetical protein
MYSQASSSSGCCAAHSSLPGSCRSLKMRSSSLNALASGAPNTRWQPSGCRRAHTPGAIWGGCLGDDGVAAVAGHPTCFLIAPGCRHQQGAVMGLPCSHTTCCVENAGHPRPAPAARTCGGGGRSQWPIKLKLSGTHTVYRSMWGLRTAAAGGGRALARGTPAAVRRRCAAGSFTSTASLCRLIRAPADNTRVCRAVAAVSPAVSSAFLNRTPSMRKCTRL